MQCFDLVLCCKEEPIQWYRFLRVQQLRRSGRLDHRISSICPSLRPFFQQLLSLGGLFGALNVLNVLNAALICRGFKNAFRGGTLRSCFRKGIPGFSRTRSGGFENETRVSGWTCIVRERHSTLCRAPLRERHSTLCRARSRDGATVHLRPRARVSEKFPKKSLAQSKKFA